MLLHLQQACLLGFLGSAAYWDWRYRKIPNWLNLCGFALGLGLALAALVAKQPVGPMFLGLLISAGVMLLLYLGGGVGGGDVKLAPGLGLLAAYPDIIRFLFYGTLVALAMILGRLAWHGEVRQQGKEVMRKKLQILGPGQAEAEAQKPERAHASASFALALAGGVIWVWLMRMM